MGVWLCACDVQCSLEVCRAQVVRCSDVWSILALFKVVETLATRPLSLVTGHNPGGSAGMGIGVNTPEYRIREMWMSVTDHRMVAVSVLRAATLAFLGKR